MQSIHLTAVVARDDPESSRYFVVPSSVVAPWSPDSATVVEGTLNGIELGPRPLKRRDDESWFVELRERWCDVAKVSTGDEIDLILRIASVTLPHELSRMVSNAPNARHSWEAMTPGQQRALRDLVLAAKRKDARATQGRKEAEDQRVVDEHDERPSLRS